MATTSKSPKAVARAALSTAAKALPKYSHPNSPKKFSQHQLFACLVLKNFLKADYRGVSAHLKDHESLRALLGLKTTPHFTTLQKASDRLLATEPVRRLLQSTLRLYYGRRRRVEFAAVDSTGLECSTASAYCVRRRHRGSKDWKTVDYHRFPKLSAVSDTRCHFILALRTGQGPRPNVDEFQPLLAEAAGRMKLIRMLADAGYDFEANHVFARQTCGVRTFIPPLHGRPTEKPAAGRYRRLMQTDFDFAAYSERVQIETVVSMIKRRQGAHVSGSNNHSRCRALRLMALTHNIMILRRGRFFYRARMSPFHPSECPLFILAAGPGPRWAASCLVLR